MLCFSTAASAVAAIHLNKKDYDNIIYLCACVCVFIGAVAAMLPVLSSKCECICRLQCFNQEMSPSRILAFSSVYLSFFVCLFSLYMCCYLLFLIQNDTSTSSKCIYKYVYSTVMLTLLLDTSFTTYEKWYSCNEQSSLCEDKCARAHLIHLG